MKYLIALLCASLSVPAFSQSPAVFRADAQHSGIYQQPGVPLLHGIKWKFKTDAAVISTACRDRRHRVLRQQRPLRVCREYCRRRATLEIQDRQPRHFVSRGL